MAARAAARTKEDSQPQTGRDRDARERAILAALGRVIAREGFAKLGVNALAREAGVDKVLIYRYFGGLDEALQAYAERGGFWYSLEEILRPPLPEDPAAWIREILRRQTDALRARPETLEILAWETVERNELTAKLESVREETGLALIAAFSKRFGTPAAELLPLATLMSAALNYLSVRARKIRTYNGLDLSKDADWQRFYDAIEAAVAPIVAPLTATGSHTPS